MAKAQSARPDRVLTFCRVCEASCGLIATREGGRIVSMEGDPDHLFSQGHFCKKAMGAVEVTYDPERVLRPLKRTGGPGEFTPISWKQAIAEIGDQLKAIRREHGPAAVATFLGQPPTNSYATAIWFNGFKKALQTKWNYAVNAEDSASFLKANEILFGSPGVMPRPDFWRTDFAIVIGANPFVSHGSICGEPLIRKCLGDVVARGGRVVVIDPRRSETAQSFEHVAVNAGSDQWLVLAMLNEIITGDLVDHGYLARHAHRLGELAALVREFTPEVAAPRCGVEAGAIRALARDFATAPRGLIYGRTGTCTQRFGTLINLLQNLLCLVTGNIDQPGGMVLPFPLLGPSPLTGGPAGATLKSRTTGLPEISGMLPSRSLITDITEPGPEQVRAMMLLGGNPVHSSGAAGPAYAEALEKLELHFSLDLYMTETNRHAHYILPVTTMYEHEDLPYKYLTSQLRPTIWASKAVIAPQGEARDEWRIMNDICRRAGVGGAYADPRDRRRAKWGFSKSPSRLMDQMIRNSDLGRRHGLSIRTLLTKYPHGKALDQELPVDLLDAKQDRIDLAPAELAQEIARLKAHEDEASLPFRLIGMREVLSQNTWMHNVPSLMPAHRRHYLHVSPADAAELRVRDGDPVEVSSAAGELRTAVKVSDRMKPGNVALPHGWGHAAGWSRANGSGGVNSNVLASKGLDDIEPLAGMSILNGIPVRIRALSPAG